MAFWSSVDLIFIILNKTIHLHHPLSKPSTLWSTLNLDILLLYVLKFPREIKKVIQDRQRGKYLKLHRSSPKYMSYIIRKKMRCHTHKHKVLMVELTHLQKLSVCASSVSLLTSRNSTNPSSPSSLMQSYSEPDCRNNCAKHISSLRNTIFICQTLRSLPLP